MGSTLEEEIGAHLRAGGGVVAASERAARALRSSYNRARRAEGLEAWAAPAISSWAVFIQDIWEQYSDRALLPLSPIQERSLWEQVIAASGHPVSLLEPSRRRVAAMAMRSHALLCSYAPRYLNPRHRQAWDKDSASFSSWLTAFDELCARSSVISPARLPHETVPLLRAELQPRPPLLVTGFDRLLPFHSALLEAWGSWRMATAGGDSARVQSFAAADPASEIAACAHWCRSRINLDAKLLVIAPDVRLIRGDLERALYREAAIAPELNFEFSLGVPLIQTGPARSADMLLRWLDGELAENELDLLFSSAYSTESAIETAGLLAGMRTLRRHGLQRTSWSLVTFLAQNSRAKWPLSWISRLRSAQNRLSAAATRTQSPAEWAELATELLDEIGWPGASPQTSPEFQAVEAWRSALEACGTLGFDGRRISWREFLAELRVTLEESIFAPESEDAQILITGPSESAGISADAIWFLGADEDAWPARGNLDPLLPQEIQRSTGMPHASAQDDWDLGMAITKRLFASAPEICFSYPMQRNAVEMRASRLTASFAGAPQTIPAALLPASANQPVTQIVEDSAAIPYHPPAAENATAHDPVPLKGGANLLTAQSQCPFRAFAISRLDASGWNPAEPGLTAAERGKILHSVLRSVWSGPPRGILTSKDLHAITDLQEFAGHHVQLCLDRELPPRARDAMPAQYIELESVRLTRLIAEWLAFEKKRIEFEVIDTEQERSRTIAGLSLTIRFDRLDRLNDDTVLVVDYKTGNVSPSAWDLPRPDDVQLPLYAGFGLDRQTEPVGGLVFAKIKPGEMCMAGRVGDATATLDPTLKGNCSLLRNRFTVEQLEDWRDTIEELARDFLAGRSGVDPRDPVKTCSRCDLHALCRIREREIYVDDEGDEDSE